MLNILTTVCLVSNLPGIDPYPPPFTAPQLAMHAADTLQPHTPARGTRGAVAAAHKAHVTSEIIKPVSAAQADCPYASVVPNSDWVAFTLVCSEPAALRLAGYASHTTFSWRGESYVRAGAPAEGGAMRATLLVTRATTAATLLDWCASWLTSPAESISIAGFHLALTHSVPTRTVADAGLGLPSGVDETSQLPYRAVLLLPWCGICFSTAANPSWTCRSVLARHSFCQACMKRYAETSMMTMMGGPLMLRCPTPGCSHTMPVEELSRLIPLDVMAAKRAEVMQAQRKRLEGIRAGHEGDELRSLVESRQARPCPQCSVLIIKFGGCHHMVRHCMCAPGSLAFAC